MVYCTDFFSNVEIKKDLMDVVPSQENLCDLARVEEQNMTVTGL